MKALVINQFGNSSEQLHMADVEMPTLEPHEVLVQVAYASVNPIDWQICQGEFEYLLPHAFPLIPGWDFAGTVKSIGEKVRRFKEGDLVYACCRKKVIQHGTYAEYLAVDASALALAPTAIDLASAACLPLPALTAYQSLFEAGKLQKGQHVLIHDGASEVGQLATQLASHAGAIVSTTVSSDEYVNFSTSLGANHVVNCEQQDFVAQLNASNAPIDLVLDLVGGDFQEASYDVLRTNGFLVSTASPPDDEYAKHYGVSADYVFPKPSGQQLKKISSLVDKQVIQPLPYVDLPLSYAPKVHASYQNGEAKNEKIVLNLQQISA